MKVKILGSSSKGNSYLLESSTGEILIIECGIAWKEILKGLNYDLKGVIACLITHEHL